MPCYFPVQAQYSLSPDGKKSLKFNTDVANRAARDFHEGNVRKSNNVLALPCGKCIGCRLERSRQWAVRCMHEASLYEDNCFITLTYRDECLPKDGSLNKKHFQDFMKRLRGAFSNVRIRVFYCGEYGENFARPHYHACLFNFDFPDKLFWKGDNENTLFTSKILEDIWGLGFCTVGVLSFDSAAYVARYCVKKVNGDKAKDHYQGRLPEFCHASNKPGIGSGWFDRWKGDAFPSDYLVVNGVKCKPPRYYDKKLERIDPAMFADIKRSRLERASDSFDNSHKRLLAREKCQQARFKKLIRTIERESL